MILSDKAIAALCTIGYYGETVSESIVKDVVDNNGVPMITPFVGESVKVDISGRKIPSYGLSSHGYDVRLAPHFKLFTKPNDGRVIDVLDFQEEEIIEEVEAESVILPPGGLLLARTIETFNMPRNVVGVCANKSTHARVGTFSLVTPLEAGWSGELVVEITNTTNLPMRIHSGIGICQIQFMLAMECEVSYGDRNGKYQNQTGITAAKL